MSGPAIADQAAPRRPGDYYGCAAAWSEERRRGLGAALLFKVNISSQLFLTEHSDLSLQAFKIFLQEGERQIRPVDLRQP